MIFSCMHLATLAAITFYDPPPSVQTEQTFLRLRVAPAKQGQ
jgi:hypothetical protein